MDCDRIRDRIEEYALGTLDADEQAAVERHLSTCAACRRLAADLEEAVSLIPQTLAAASPLVPPARMKNRLMRSLTASADAVDATGVNSIRPVPSSTADNGRGSPPTVARLRPSRETVRTFAWVAAVLVLAVSLTWSVRLTLALERERNMRAEMAALVGQTEIVFEVLDSDQSARHFLLPQQEDSTAYGKIFTRADLPHVVVMANRLPEAPPGQTFHLWLTQDGRTTLAGELTVDDGYGILLFDADRDGPTYDAAELTLQSPGGTSPDGPLILRWDADEA